VPMFYIWSFGVDQRNAPIRTTILIHLG
jgi:hypothetical protein